jgi:hypothetical protein
VVGENLMKYCGKDAFTSGSDMQEMPGSDVLKKNMCKEHGLHAAFINAKQNGSLDCVKVPRLVPLSTHIIAFNPKTFPWQVPGSYDPIFNHQCLNLEISCPLRH